MVRRDWPLWILMAGLLITAVCVYPHLPDQVPSHWNIRGEVIILWEIKPPGLWQMRKFGSGLIVLEEESGS